MKKLKIAFIATSGLWYGGTEKCTQKQAIALREAGHDVDYFYTATTHYTNGNSHPGLDWATKNHVESFGIRTIPVQCESIDALNPQKEWNNTDLFNIFNASNYDVVIGNHKGEPMWPYSVIKNSNVIEVVHGTDFSRGTSSYADGYILITPYQMPLWQKGGGVVSKTSIIPQMVMIEQPKINNDRARWELPENKIIFGMHQGARSGLFSHVVLEAFSKISSEENFFVILGGDPEYTNQANKLGLKNFKQIPSVSDPEQISSFLSCLDVFAHGRFDGEVSSSSIIEAMSRSLPIISHPSVYNNGHLEQLRNAGIIVETFEDYSKAMYLLQTNASVRNQLSQLSKKKYDEVYDHDLCKNEFVSFVESIVLVVNVNSERKIAEYSADHQQPKGSICDNYSSSSLLDEIKYYFKKDDIKFLDLGCAGGQLVRDARNRRWFSIGLEGSDSATRGEGLKNWLDLKDRNLFLTDISEKFEITVDNKPVKFDLIHSEEVLEHIQEDKIDTVFQNIKNHLSEEGVVFLGIAMFSDEEIIVGKLYVYHTCVHDKAWWKEKIEKNGLEIFEVGKNDDYHAGFIFSSKNRDHQDTLYICAKHKTQ
jgi:2-polyprenyl-3-methyl-5-hydroxy-6-metoxy-1,4-benzoquinol methylase